MTPEMQKIESIWQNILELACLILLIFGIVSVIALAKAAGPGTGAAPAGSMPQSAPLPVGPAVNRTLPTMDTLGTAQSGTTILPSTNLPTANPNVNPPGGLVPSYPGPFGAPGTPANNYPGPFGAPGSPGNNFMSSTPGPLPSGLLPGGGLPGPVVPGQPPTSPTQ